MGQNGKALEHHAFHSMVQGNSVDIHKQPQTTNDVRARASINLLVKLSLHCFTLSHDCNIHYLMGPRGAAQGDGFDSPTSPRRHSAYSASFRDDATIVGIHALHIMSLCGVCKSEYIHMYRVCIIYSYAHIYIYTHYDA